MTGSPARITLARAFALHHEAAAAAGRPAVELAQYAADEARYLALLRRLQCPPPFALELLNPRLLRVCMAEVRARSPGVCGILAAEQLEASLRAVSAWIDTWYWAVADVPLTACHDDREAAARDLVGSAAGTGKTWSLLSRRQT